MLITPTQVTALSDCDVPFANVAYRGVLIAAASWTVFLSVYQVTSAGVTAGQTLVYGPVVATITSNGAGTPTIPAQFLTPQSTFLARLQAFNQGGLLTPPADGSFKVTLDQWVATEA